eukprot:CAMPEP_0169200062 /NCGR_PEP_ID=MMETSP1016-20121227/9673_1 /TAXON_ID=342587 /ORGANISM="Karlodinium micrum, Strain CCMP2283" /LENGTH=400 /DNA_ID=CAMNT_0009276895 /DNA_START=50 /DNA_END=1252 /DNA_ORIENTATION=-
MAEPQAAPSSEEQASSSQTSSKCSDSIVKTRHCQLSDTECGSDSSVEHYGSEEEQSWPTHFVLSTESDDGEDAQSQFAIDSDHSSEMDRDWDWSRIIEALELSDQYVFDADAIAGLLNGGATSSDLTDHFREEMASHLEQQAMSFLEDAERPCTTSDLTGRMTPPLPADESTSLEGPRWRISERRSSLRKSLESGCRRRRSCNEVDCLRATRKSLARLGQHRAEDIDSKMAFAHGVLSDARRWRRLSIDSVLRSIAPETQTPHEAVFQSRIEEAVSIVKAGLGNLVADQSVAHSEKEFAARQTPPLQPSVSECTKKIWRVVGGRETNGIIARRDRSLTSPVLDERLAWGSRVQELRLIGNRLQYRRFEGSGPQTGWVTVTLTGARPLVVPLSESHEQAIV